MLVTQRNHSSIKQQVYADSLKAAMVAIVLMIVMVVTVLSLNRRLVIRPSRNITGTMSTLADGDHVVDFAALGRRDEIGAIAHAVEVFKLLHAGIAALLEAVDAASHGDLGYPIDCATTDDELGMIVVALNGLFEKLRNSFHEIEQSAEGVTSAANELNDLGKLITRSSNKRHTMVN